MAHLWPVTFSPGSEMTVGSVAYVIDHWSEITTIGPILLWPAVASTVGSQTTERQLCSVSGPKIARSQWLLYGHLPSVTKHLPPCSDICPL